MTNAAALGRAHREGFLCLGEEEVTTPKVEAQKPVLSLLVSPPNQQEELANSLLCSSLVDATLKKPSTVENAGERSQSFYEGPFWRSYGLLTVHLSMVVCQSCFAGVNVFGKYGMAYVHPIVLIVFRNMGTLPFLVAGVVILERKQVRRCITFSNVVKFTAIGVFTMLLSQSLYVFGLRLTTATNSATLHLAIPVWTCMICMSCGMELFSLAKVIGIGCAIGGALVMTEVEKFDLSGDAMMGNVLVLMMTVLFSLYLVFCKPLVAHLPPLNVSMWIFITASIASVPLVLFYWSEMCAALQITDWKVWMSVALAVVMGTAIPYLIITWAIKQASPVVVAIYTPMELISTTTLAFLFLGEEPGLRQLAGAACILAGLLVTTYAQQTEKKTNLESTVDIEQQNEVPTPLKTVPNVGTSETTPLIAYTA